MNPLPITLAAISGDNLINAVLWIVVGGLIFWLLHYLITSTGIPEPFNKIARVVLLVVAVIFLINVLLMIVGRPFIRW